MSQCSRSAAVRASKRAPSTLVAGSLSGWAEERPVERSSLPQSHACGAQGRYVRAIPRASKRKQLIDPMVSLELVGTNLNRPTTTVTRRLTNQGLFGRVALKQNCRTANE